MIRGMHLKSSFVAEARTQCMFRTVHPNCMPSPSHLHPYLARMARRRRRKRCRCEAEAVEGAEGAGVGQEEADAAGGAAEAAEAAWAPSGLEADDGGLSLHINMPPLAKPLQHGEPTQPAQPLRAGPRSMQEGMDWPSQYIRLLPETGTCSSAV